MKHTVALLALLILAIAAAPASGSDGVRDGDGVRESDGSGEIYWDGLNGLVGEIGGWDLHLGGRIVVDAIKYGHANERDSGLELDDARLVFEGGYGDFRFRVEPDLVGTDTRDNLFEAWGAYEIDPALRLKAGQLRVALSSEFATREEDLPLVGYGFGPYLDGRYDVGLRADGCVLREGLWYEATATAGRGFGLEGDRLDNPQYSLRIVSHPFRWIDAGDAFDGFFVGLGLAYSPDGDVPVVVTNPFESVVFRTDDLDGDSAGWRHIEVGYYTGPVRVAWERVVGTVNDVPVGGGLTEDMDQITSWTLAGSWNITGEDQAWARGAWTRDLTDTPAWPDAESIFPGRWEVAARYSNADIDRALFDYGLATYDPSTQEVRTFSLDLNWFPHEKLRAALGWVKTIADHELTTFGGTDRDSSFVLRMEVNF